MSENLEEKNPTHTCPVSVGAKKTVPMPVPATPFLFVFVFLLPLTCATNPILPLTHPDALDIHGAPHVHRRAAVRGDPRRYVWRSEAKDAAGDGYALLDYNITLVRHAEDLDAFPDGALLLLPGCTPDTLQLALRDVSGAADIARRLLHADFVFAAPSPRLTAICGLQDGTPLYRAVLDAEGPRPLLAAELALAETASPGFTAGGAVILVELHTAEASLVQLLEPFSRISLRHRPSRPPEEVAAARKRRKNLEEAADDGLPRDTERSPPTEDGAVHHQGEKLLLQKRKKEKEKRKRKKAGKGASRIRY